MSINLAKRPAPAGVVRTIVMLSPFTRAQGDKVGGYPRILQSCVGVLG